MDNNYEHTSLWQTAFAPKDDGCNEQRDRLIAAYTEFRKRVSNLLQLIRSELPGLTVHDITHVDKLWDVASEIAGPSYPFNPSEAFVLGGAFLLHDAAHCRAAFPGGLAEIQTKTEWKDVAAQHNFKPEALIPGSAEFQTVLFDTLRVLHPKQARTLAFASWAAPGETPQLLLPDDELRNAYGAVIGEIAESHWWHPHHLETLANRTINAPVCLQPAKWLVDGLKLAALLRTSDAAHLDANRAPRFLYALVQPQGISRQHWHFQSKLHQATVNAERQELRITGEPFSADEQEAWWLAYDNCRMLDGELRAVDRILRDHGRERFLACSLADAHNPEDFARHIPTPGWQTVDAGIKITDINSLVERFGGEKLYGDKPWIALRELIQNARDAVEACRKLGGLRPHEGEIEVELEITENDTWLHVTDDGIGMSRYVLTSVLLDFGRSLWRSPELLGEWAGLPASRFNAVGQFGIGFFSVFMLGNEVKVLTRRYEAKEGEDANALLYFSNGTASRPVLLQPSKEERLKRHGTRVSVRLLPKKLEALRELTKICAHLAPALAINLYTKEGDERQCAVRANDWLEITAQELLGRIVPLTGDLNSTKKTANSWLHLERVNDKQGRCRGRCAIQDGERYRWMFPSAIGVIGGINAAQIEGMTGIIEARNQKDLARQTAIPAISLAEIQTWAESQKQYLINISKLTIGHSNVLAAIGCSYSGLIVGYLEGTEISFEDLQKTAGQHNEFLLHGNQVEHDDEDGIPRSQFRDGFKPVENLLEIPYSPRLEWLSGIEATETDATPYSLQDAATKALETVLGAVDCCPESGIVVGAIDSIKIERDCTIVTPTDPID